MPAPKLGRRLICSSELLCPSRALPGPAGGGFVQPSFPFPGLLPPQNSGRGPAGTAPSLHPRARGARFLLRFPLSVTGFFPLLLPPPPPPAAAWASRELFNQRFIKTRRRDFHQFTPAFFSIAAGASSRGKNALISTRRRRRRRKTSRERRANQPQNKKTKINTQKKPSSPEGTQRRARLRPLPGRATPRQRPRSSRLIGAAWP